MTYFLVYNECMKVVVLGKGLMLANIVLGALDAGAEIVGVFRYEQTTTNPIKLFFKDMFCSAPEVTLLKKLKLNEIKMKSANSKEFRKLMVKLNVDLIIVGTWKEKLTKETFNIPKIATVNVHPSLLPKYRGPNPYMQTILQGEEYSGITLHLMDENFDSGPILAQEKIKILPEDTSKELRERTVKEARKLIRELITDLNNKIITPIPQNEKAATYFANISGDEKMIDFSTQSSDEISRTVRALHPFLPCYITHKKDYFIINPYKIKILQHKSSDYKPNDIIAKNAKTSSLTIICKDNNAIAFSDLKLYKKPLRTKKYIEKHVKITCEQ